MKKRAWLIAAAATLALGPASLSPCLIGTAAARGFACCKICSVGKACGDSCIARDKTCHKGKGCACDG
ncbi:MAG TPA: hypothetical protein VF650_01985 [Allosphingosinicella sp.]